MPKLPRLTSQQAEKMLLDAGFELIRKSHILPPIDRYYNLPSCCNFLSADRQVELRSS